MFLGHDELQKQAAHYLPIILERRNRIVFRAVDEADRLERNGFVAAPVFFSAPGHTGREEATGAQSEKRLIAVDYLNAVAVESLPEFYMRRLAGTARRGKSYALPVKRNKSGMKDGGIIIEDGGADLFLHCDALQKSIRKHLRRAQKKLSELLFVFFIGPNRKQRSLIGEVLTAHIRKVRVRAGDTYR